MHDNECDRYLIMMQNVFVSSNQTTKDSLIYFYYSEEALDNMTEVKADRHTIRMHMIFSISLCTTLTFSV